MPEILAGVRLLLGLLPVFSFLVALILLDSYKLVRLSWVARVVVAGALTAVASLFLNRLIVNVFGIEGVVLARYVAPVVEELLKGAVVAVLVVRGLRIAAAARQPF